MKLTTILLSFALYLRVSGFAPTLKETRATHLSYNIVMPPEDDTDNEESVFERKRKEKADEDAHFREKCDAEGINLSEIDRAVTPDMHNNPMGSLMPGVHLTALCGDD